MTASELESILFVAGFPGISIETLCSAHNCTELEIKKTIVELQNICEHNRIYNLVSDERNYYLSTKPEYSECISKTRSAVAREPLTRAQSETLSLVLYLKSPVTKTMIDKLRGVNSIQPLRVLESRGLITRNGEVAGSTLYRATSDVFHHLGISHQSQLPEFEQLAQSLAAWDEAL